jgi:hypothetical protein
VEVLSEMGKREEINKKLEKIFEESFSTGSAWEKIKELAETEGKEEVYTVLLENILDDLIENEKQVKDFLKKIGWEIEEA